MKMKRMMMTSWEVEVRISLFFFFFGGGGSNMYKKTNLRRFTLLVRDPFKFFLAY